MRLSALRVFTCVSGGGYHKPVVAGFGVVVMVVIGMRRVVLGRFGCLTNLHAEF